MTPARIAARPCPLVLALAAAGALITLLACNGHSPTPPTFGGSLAPLLAACETSGTVQIGGADVPVTVRFTRGSSGASGETVSFLSSRGVISPSSALTDSNGEAVAFLQTPATAGTVLIDASVTSRIDGTTAMTECALTVSSPRDPQVTVQLLAPATAAGLNLRVRYDASRVTLPAGSARPAGPFTNASCITLANDDGVGLVTLDMACPTSSSAAGNVGVFSFRHVTGPDVTANDFLVDCTSYDVQGNARTGVCQAVVTLL